MKLHLKLFSIFLILSCPSVLTAADEFISLREADTTTKESGNSFTPKFYKNKIILFGGYHSHIYGYLDQRYVDDDKSDYISTDSEQAGAEYFTTDFSTLSRHLKHVRLGGSVVFYRRGQLDQRTLYAVASQSIDEETIPANMDQWTSKFWLNFGFFGGYHRKWWGADLGLTVIVGAYDEKYRLRYNTSGDIVQTSGRGILWNNATVLPNFHLRLGSEKGPHYTFDILRQDYDARYGFIQSKLVFPVVDFFTMKIGAYHYKTNAIFIEPEFSIWGVSLSLKFGTILNYYDKEVRRVGFSESLFYGGSLSYKW